jgi:hypothetical protein
MSAYDIPVPVKAVELYLDLRKLLEEHVKVSANIVICVPLHLGFMFSFINHELNMLYAGFY